MRPAGHTSLEPPNTLRYSRPVRFLGLEYLRASDGLSDLKMIAIALMATLLAGAPVWASLDESTTRVPVTVWIYDGFGVTVDDMTAARAEAR